MEYLFYNPQTEQKAFLGKGWAFPPDFDRTNGKVAMAQYEEDIRQSLHILFSTSIRERVLQPAYGCNPEDYVFTPLTVTFLSTLEDLLRKNVARHEPRIKLLSLVVEASQTEGQLEIKLDYIVRKTNTRFNMVYPFYKQEGTNVEI
ncbi:GPW/gp25 family protein [Chitinophaga lutea]